MTGPGGKRRRVVGRGSMVRPPTGGEGGAAGEPGSGSAGERAGEPAGATARTAHRAGFAAIVGRPNVGKSTLLNAVLGVKLAIVTPKPQTTRHRILGIKTLPAAQVLFVDTPGIHRAKSLLNERMVDVARRSLIEADVGLWVVDAQAGLLDADVDLAAELARSGRPTVVAVNKLDLVPPGQLLKTVGRVGELLPGRDVVPVSARRESNLDELVRTIVSHLPESPALYPADAQTDLPERFFAAEFVREQLFLALHEELPYQVAVEVEGFSEREGRDLLDVAATILVARESQRAIVLGEKGARIKAIGRAARLQLEEFFGIRVFLELHVKVLAGWPTSVRRLGELGL